MRLILTRLAARQLAEILDYIGERNPQGARRVQQRVQVILQMLLQQPEAGMATNKPMVRRIVTSPYPYVIYYQHRDDELIVRRVRHTARRPS